MGGTGFPDLIEVLLNAGKVAPALLMLMQGIVAVIGLYLVGSALVELWGVSYDNALKYVAGRQRFSTGSALISLLIGALMSALSTLNLMGVLSRTFSDDYASERIMPSSMAYSAADSIANKGAAAAVVLLSIMQVVGFVAMVKSLLTINRYYNNEQADLGSAATWAIGGILAWNFQWFANVVNNTLGFSIISIFTPFV
jgi:hypothetical protein